MKSERRPLSNLSKVTWVDSGPFKDIVVRQYTDERVIYPITIVQARYGGTYEGTAWLAFPCHPEELKGLCPSWDGDDTDCYEFWIYVGDSGWAIGKGHAPEEAHESLMVQIKRLVEEKKDGTTLP